MIEKQLKITEPMQQDYLSNLNAGQMQAVESTEGAVLVLAGAGTGKTRVLTTRLVHILRQQLAWPSQILAVTFTNKAAREMKDRIQATLGQAVEGLWLGTFHSLTLRILRRHAELVDLTPDFTILDADDQLRLIKQLLKADNLEEKKFPSRAVLSVISRWKDRGLTPDKVSYEESQIRDKSWFQVTWGIYKQYQQRLKTLNAVDFGDMLLLCVDLFVKHPEVLQTYQNQFRYILVDEYQDTNVIQYLWLRLLAQSHANICCVGDDDQSIYSWRGAEIANILKFEKDFPGAKVVRLEQNYRSTSHILAAASSLIANNASRLGKTLWTERQDGEKVEVLGTWDGQEEARVVGEKIEQLRGEGTRLNSVAILVRASFQTREFEDRFIKIGLPYRIIGGARFYERKEIRDAMAYLRIVAQPKDSLAFERIVNTPRRGIGNTTVQNLHQYANHHQISLLEAAHRLINTGEIKGKARASLTNLLISIDRWRGIMGTGAPSELAKIILDESGYTAMWQADSAPDAPGRLENLKELVRALEAYDTLPGFLEHVSLVMENDANRELDCVSLMTLHSAKGLEFDTVFLVGWEEGLFPHIRALEESGNKGLEEERRLAYVGLTRAKDKAIITYTLSRCVHGTWQSSIPSRFLQELPDEHVVKSKDTGQSSNWSPRIVEPPRIISSGNYQIGDRVFHEKFGYGYVTTVEGQTLEIKFEHTDKKRIMSDFVEAG